MKKFTRDNVKVLHSVINAEMEKIAQKYGFIYEPGMARFGDDDVDIKMTFKIPSEAGSPYTRDEREYANMFRTALGIPTNEEALGTRWDYKGTVYVLDKIQSKVQYPLIMHREDDGRGIRFSVESIKSKDLKLIR